MTRKNSEQKRVQNPVQKRDPKRHLRRLLDTLNSLSDERLLDEFDAVATTLLHVHPDELSAKCPGIVEVLTERKQRTDDVALINAIDELITTLSCKVSQPPSGPPPTINSILSAIEELGEPVDFELLAKPLLFDIDKSELLAKLTEISRRLRQCQGRNGITLEEIECLLSSLDRLVSADTDQLKEEPVAKDLPTWHEKLRAYVADQEPGLEPPQNVTSGVQTTEAGWWNVIRSYVGDTDDLPRREKRGTSRNSAWQVIRSYIADQELEEMGQVTSDS